MKLPVCCCCGQIVPRRRTLQMEILALVKQAGAEGILSDKLFDALYDFDSEGGPLTGKRTLYVAINQLNKRLRAVKQEIRAPRSGKGRPERYRLHQL